MSTLREGHVRLTVVPEQSDRYCNLCSSDLEEKRKEEGVRFYKLAFYGPSGQSGTIVMLCHPHLEALEKEIH